MSKLARTFLFVPASRPDRYEKALSSPADQVLIDLEDAVASVDKDQALDSLVSMFEAGLSRPAYVRINSPGTEWHGKDLQALNDLSPNARESLAGIFIPKLEVSEEVKTIREALADGPELDLIGLIETGFGLANAPQLAKAPGLSRFAIGAADLSVDLDVPIDSPTIAWAYSQLVVESRMAGLQGPIASPPFDLKNLDKIESEAVRLKALGATAQMCIHPAQIHAISSAFHPTEEEIAWAQRISEAFSHNDGASQADGQMIDKPIYERARRILNSVVKS